MRIITTLVSFLVVLQNLNTYCQNWETGTLNNGAFGVNFGNLVNQPINIFTNNIQKAQFSTGFSLGPGIIPSANSGDGLRIMPRTLGCTSPSLPGTGALDLWTGCSNNTNIRWDGSGQISGTNNRFEQWANLNGFFFNTTLQGGSGVYKFARNQLVTGFIGTNNYWRIGEQNDVVNLNGQRRLHVVDNTTQFRLSYSNPSSNGVLFTDFLSNSVGNLQIQPSSGRVGINAPSDPTATIDVFGDARIRNVQTAIPDALIVGVEVSSSNPNDLNIRKLEFPPQLDWVLYSDGNWGPLPSSTPNIFANNGCSKIGNFIQLGEVYNNNQTVPLLNDREIVMDDHNVVFSGKGQVGIGQVFPNLPTEKLDVAGNARLRNLPNVVNQANNTMNKVVMVDNTGVLRWKDISSFGGVNSAVNGSWINGLNQVEWGTNPLDHNTEIPMNGNNVAFTNLPGGVSLTNNFKIGGDATSLPVKLAVINDVESIGALVVSNSPNFGGTTRSGVVGLSENAYIPSGVVGKGLNGVRVYGVQGAGTNGTLETIGVYGGALSNLGNGSVYGGKFRAESNTLDFNFGVNGYATGSPKTNIGGCFIGSGGSTSIGLYAEASSTVPGALVCAAYFAGPITFGGTLIPSDSQFKTNVSGIQNATSVLNALSPVSYDYVQTGNASYMHFPSNNQFGLIAQEVELILPEIVSLISHPEQMDSLGNIVVPSFDYKTVKYDALIPILIKGHQEQNARIDSLTNINTIVNNNNDSLEIVVSDLNARLTQLENCLSNILPALCNANSMAVQSTPSETQEYLEKAINVTLSNRNNIVLNQNVPNPFAESTIITYSIPSTVQKAQIHFYDGAGKLINSVDITERGNGQLNVFANDLSTGVYTYSLVADGQIVSTKRMMKQ